jgi:hypothetical protein
VRWSYRRDYGDVRLLVLDSRGGRVLETGERSMVDAAEWDWIVEQTRDCASHLLLASSLPVLLPPAVHGLEAWNEAVCDGAWGPRWARWGEKVRQGADLEHWAAFRSSFERLLDLVADVGAGRAGPAPASITFLGGDVHFSYLAEARFPRSREVTSAVHQAVCSPVRNPVYVPVQKADRFARTRAGRALGRLLMRSAGVPLPPVDWEITQGPWFSNMIGALELEGRTSVFRLERSVDDDEPLETVLERTTPQGRCVGRSARAGDELPVGVGDAGQEARDAGALGLGQPVGRAGAQGEQRAELGEDVGRSGRRDLEDLPPPVRRVGRAHDVAGGLQPVDGLGRRRRGDPQPAGELDGAERLAGEHDLLHRLDVVHRQPEPTREDGAGERREGQDLSERLLQRIGLRPRRGLRHAVQPGTVAIESLTSLAT